MKTLTKEDLPIGTKVVPHDKTIGKPFNEWSILNSGVKYCKVNRHDEGGFLSCDGEHFNYSDITLYEPTPKIKKSELLNRIEVLEKKVAELAEKSKVTIVYPPTWANDPSTVIGSTIEVEAEQPQFEVGKVYKKNDSLIIFYCTEINDLEAIGFGIGYAGSWLETARFASHSRIDHFTEATPEEWFKRLEEEAKKRYPKGCKVKCLHRSKYNKIDSLNFEGFHSDAGCLRHKDLNSYVCCVMDSGKWAEIIEQPQYQIGTIGIFWDGDFEEAMSKGWLLFGELDHITENGHFRRKGASWLWYNFKPIKID